MRYSQLWRKVRAAMKVGKIDTFFDMPPEMQALIVAAVEQQDEIDRMAAQVSNMPALPG